MALSPMMEHYLKVKDKYKDCVVFYRLGDFYEMFFDDAVRVSKLLDLTLTGRDCGLTERAPMCGIPFHAADMYIDKLVSLGEKVAICEQLTEPNGKELVERDVIKVVTAGTVTNDEFIDDKCNNFLSCVYENKGVFGISWTDITTGEFFAEKIENDLSALFNLLIKIAPAEIITDSSTFDLIVNSPLVSQGILPKPSVFTESEFSFYSANISLKNQLNLNSINGIWKDDKDLSIISSGALISYLNETQKKVLINIDNIKVQGEEGYMELDHNAIRNLELVKTNRDQKKYGSLLWLLDKTKTSMGARKLQGYLLSPLVNEKKINYRLDAVEDLFNSNVVRQSISDLLSNVNDIGRITGKISNGNLLPKDCVALYKSLEILPNIIFKLSGLKSQCISDIVSEISDFSSLTNLLRSAIVDGVGDPDSKEKNDFKYIKSGYNQELDSLRELFTNNVGIIAKIEKREREKLGIKNLRIGYNRVFGYYIEITNAFKDKAPYDYIRRQTLSNSERFVTEELKDLENKILNAEENATKLELSLYNEIKNILAENIVRLKETAEAVAELDVLIAFANLSKENNYCRPNIKPFGSAFNVVEGRHPVIESTSKQRFVPNDCVLDASDNRTMIITGPNMAGKSTFMRQNALIAIMAHVGCFVPAKSADIPLIDKIFTRIGASDSLITDQSTFMVEMSETADILKNATQNSLIILDEIGRGTSTFDGLSIAWAVLEYVTKNVRAKTLFATHYHELTEIEELMEGVKNFKITVRELNGSIIFMRKIMRGKANRSFGIEVAELAGVKKDVTIRAKEILKGLEKKGLSSHNETCENEEKPYSEVETIIKELDLNNVSPIQAFNLLADLHEKVNNK